jgi:hypothetical protein
MISRRVFCQQTAVLAAAGLSGSTLNPALGCSSTLPLSADQRNQNKKGFCWGLKKDENWRKKLTDLKAKWFYSWCSELPEDLPAGLEFVPMIWTLRYTPPEAVFSRLSADFADGKFKVLMGFNEPDQAKQANMTVEEALDAWPKLMELNIPLASPGCVHPDREWMKEFMKGVEERKLRVDYVCAHSYGGPSAKALLHRMQQVYDMFGKPIWITEFGVGDWQAQDISKNRHSVASVTKFMQEVIPLLNESKIIDRYSWFSAKPDNRALGTSALFDEAGNLTSLGECYAEL